MLGLSVWFNKKISIQNTLNKVFKDLLILLNKNIIKLKKYKILIIKKDKQKHIKLFKILWTLLIK